MNTASQLTPERIRYSLRSRFNPIRSLTPELLAMQIDQFNAGYLSAAARTWDAIERRDDKLPAVRGKRLSAIARYGFEIVICDEADSSAADEGTATAAQQHKEALEFFYSNLTAVNALDENQRGGLSLAVRQMADAIGKRYSVHEIVWKPGELSQDGGLTAELRWAPLWFFENTTGKLRFLKTEGSTTGEEMLPEAWMVTCGDGIMEACSVAYMYKRLPLVDWLSFSEVFGTPGILGRTSAAKGTPAGDAMRDAVESFSQDWRGTVYGDDGNPGTGISFIKAEGGSSTLPFPDLIERMDRAMTILWRGADLSTMSAGQGQGQGASVQSDETDLIEQDDAAWISETLQTQLSRRVIEYHFGPGTRPLAYIRIKTRDAKDTRLDLEIDKFLLDAGAPLAIGETLERYGRSLPAATDELLQKPAAALGPMAGEGGGQRTDGGGDPLANARPPHRDRQMAKFLNASQLLLGNAFARTMQPLRNELERVLRSNDGELIANVEALRAKLPVLLKRVGTNSEAAQALYQILSAAFLNGVTKGEPAPAP